MNGTSGTTPTQPPSQKAASSTSTFLTSLGGLTHSFFSLSSLPTDYSFSVWSLLPSNMTTKSNLEIHRANIRRIDTVLGKLEMKIDVKQGVLRAKQRTLRLGRQGTTTEVVSVEIKKIEEELDKLQEMKKCMQEERVWEVDKEACCWWEEGSRGLHQELEEGEKAWDEYAEMTNKKLDEAVNARKEAINDKEEGGDEMDDCVLITSRDLQ